jgi:hypothetical protein
MTVQFSNVGRGQKSWAVEMPHLDYSALYRAVKKAGALGSRDVDFEWDSETQTGAIFVGGFRQVGSFTVSDHHIEAL